MSTSFNIGDWVTPTAGGPPLKIVCIEVMGLGGLWFWGERTNAEGEVIRVKMTFDAVRASTSDDFRSRL